MHAQGNTQVLKRPEKAKFTSQDELSTETPYSNKTKQKSQNKAKRYLFCLEQRENFPSGIVSFAHPEVHSSSKISTL